MGSAVGYGVGTVATSIQDSELNGNRARTLPADWIEAVWYLDRKSLGSGVSGNVATAVTDVSVARIGQVWESAGVFKGDPRP